MRAISPNHLFYLALLSRLFILLLSCLSHYLIPPYDTSSHLSQQLHSCTSSHDLFFSSFSLSPSLSLSNWDSLHFLSISDVGYQHEKQHAFFPIFPLVIRSLSNALQFLLGERVHLCRWNWMIVSGLLISHLCFLLSSYYLYHLTLRLSSSPSFSSLSTLFFLFSPSSIFLSSLYSESLYSALSFYGLYSLEMNRWWRGSITLGLSGGVRSNGIVWVGIVGWKMIEEGRERWGERDLERERSGKRKGTRERWWRNLDGEVWKGLMGICLRFLVSSFLILLPYLSFQFWSASLYCSPSSPASSSSSPSLALPAYCSYFLFPNVYAYIQAKYWNIGLFRYYQVKQLPNFLLALPVWMVGWKAMREYTKRNGKKMMTLGWMKDEEEEKEKGKDHPFFSLSLLVYFYHFAFLLFVCVTVLHVQVSTRFLCSAAPMYWYLAYVCGERGDRASAKKWRRFVCLWSGAYGVVGSVLFSNFLPWT